MLPTDPETVRAGWHGLPCSSCPIDKASHELVSKNGKWYTTCELSQAVKEKENHSMPIGQVVDIKRLKLPRMPGDVSWNDVRKTCASLQSKKAYELPLPEGTTMKKFAAQVRSAFRKIASRYHIVITENNSIAIFKR